VYVFQLLFLGVHEKKIMKAKFMKDKLAILAITGVVAVMLTGCMGYYPYDYRSGYYSSYGNQNDYKSGPAYGYGSGYGTAYGHVSGYYPHMYDWYSQPLYGRGYYGGYSYPYQDSSGR
jgi:hypothetical protein